MHTPKDTIQGFIFEDKDIRGQIVYLSQSLNDILGPHHYPAPIQQLLTEAILSAVLMSATIKFKGQLTLQFQSKEVLQLLLVKCSDDFKIRALAQFDDAINEKTLTDCLNNGQLVVTIEADKNNKPYQSIVPIKGGIKNSLEYYFLQSEQLPTYFYFALSDCEACGLLLQALPCTPDKAETAQENWNEIKTLADTLSAKECLTLKNENLIFRLYHESRVRLFPHKAVSFFCPCSRSRMLEAVKIMGEENVNDVFKTNKNIDVTCEFCLEYYSFSKYDTDYLFKKQ